MSTKPLAVPSDHGVGLHDDQGGAPILPTLGEEDPEQSVRRSELRTFHRSRQHGRLLTEREVRRRADQREHRRVIGRRRHLAGEPPRIRFASAPPKQRPTVRKPTDLMIAMARAMQYSMETMGVQPAMRVSQIYSAQDVNTFFRHATRQLKSKG
jgi:hypothetical protein